jgi:hypothetical protein
MKYTITLLLTLLSTLVFSQNYPVQTVLKGDSVVILTTEQYRDIELLLDNQRNRVLLYQSDISNLKQEIDSLNIKLVDVETNNDSLNNVIENRFSDYDSLLLKYKTVESWLYNVSVDNAYLYYSYRENTIMSIDLSSYTLDGYYWSGGFLLSRRGPAIDDMEWKKCNRLYPQEPELGWELRYREKWRPIVIKFPYKIELP